MQVSIKTSLLYPLVAVFVISTYLLFRIIPPTENGLSPNRFVNPSCSSEAYKQTRRCTHFSLYVYQQSPGEKGFSQRFQNVMSMVIRSPYLTNNPSNACLLVPYVDTLDQDRLSPDYLPNLGNALMALPYWNEGRNHLIFNLYTGTWPDYSSRFDFSTGYAILAKASMVGSTSRPDLDISLPLFDSSLPVHSRYTPRTPLAIGRRKYLASFKGKRYLKGIGSDVRNVLRFIHNNVDMIFLTTCRHIGWKAIADRHCDSDEELYIKYNYSDLLQESDFCLVPRGRRVGSYRFSEVLRAGCIPVVMSDDWTLPFSRVLDWSKASIQVPEKDVLLLSHILRQVPTDAIVRMRKQSLFLYETYLSSMERIIQTTLEVAKDQMMPHLAREYRVWNEYPGALFIDRGYSIDLSSFPFYVTFREDVPVPFTVVIRCHRPVESGSKKVLALIRQISELKDLQQIVLLWMVNSSLPDQSIWPATRAPIKIVRLKVLSPNYMFFNFDLFNTDALVTLDDNANISNNEILAALQVWRSQPYSLVGYVPAAHLHSSPADNIRLVPYSEQGYSIVHTGASVYHRYYHHLYFHRLDPLLHRYVGQVNDCAQVLFNILVTMATRKSPVTLESPSKRILGDPFIDHAGDLSSCLDKLREYYIELPLILTKERYHPLPVRLSFSPFHEQFK